MEKSEINRTISLHLQLWDYGKKKKKNTFICCLLKNTTGLQTEEQYYQEITHKWSSHKTPESHKHTHKATLFCRDQSSWYAPTTLLGVRSDIVWRMSARIINQLCKLQEKRIDAPSYHHCDEKDWSQKRVWLKPYELYDQMRPRYKKAKGWVWATASGSVHMHVQLKSIFTAKNCSILKGVFWLQFSNLPN